MKIDFPSPRQFPQLHSLWQEAFGDTDDFINSFFALGFSPQRCRCLTVDGTVAAALYWFVTDFDGKPVAYLYAVATKKSHRGQGLCRMLLADTHQLLQSKGFAGALLVPGSSELKSMYQKLDYAPATTLTEFSCTPSGAPAALRRIDPEEYARLRRLLLPTGSILQEKENLAFLSANAEFYAGQDLLLCTQKTQNKLFCPEFLGAESAAPSVLQALHCSAGMFRTPGTEQIFSLYYPLNDPEIPKYFAFAFD
jgi:hypothetical protein